ncbi:methylated-DNA--[protein]-cysteine S-methyltransferase [Streptococcus dentiloxodontae]
MLRKQFYNSPLGQMILLADDAGLLGVYFAGQKYELRGYEDREIAVQSNDMLDRAKSWLTAYFAAQNPDLSDLVLTPTGTDFQHKVWAALAEVPYGQTVTYGQLADSLKCKSAQAIGGAVGKNPLSIIVPCHRVLGADGKLTGYAGGLERKIWLLEHETHKGGENE